MTDVKWERIPLLWSAAGETALASFLFEHREYEVPIIMSVERFATAQLGSDDISAITESSNNKSNNY